MDDTFLKRLEALIQQGQRTDTDIGVALLAGGCALTSLEPYNAVPYHHRAIITTHSIEDFCTYVDNDASGIGQSVIFIDATNANALAVLDYGNPDAPLWGHHRANLRLIKTPEFDALEKACAATMDQQALINYLEDWQDIKPVIDGKPDATLADAIRAIRTVDINASAKKTSTVGNFNASQSSLEQIEAKSGADALPGEITLECEVYADTGRHTISARLNLRTGGTAPAFGLRIIGKEALLRDVAATVETIIKGKIGPDKAAVYVAKLDKHQ